MFVDGVVLELRIAFGADGVPGILQATVPGRDSGRGAVGVLHKVAGAFERGVHALGPDQGISAARRDCGEAERLDAVERAAPVTEMAIAAIAGGVSTPRCRR